MTACKRTKQESAFTLIEVMISLTLLVTIVFAVSQLIKSGFDVKAILSQKAKITHRFDVALEAISRDLGSAFILSSKDTARDGNQKRTIFQITKGDTDKLAFTYSSHRAIRANAKESDLSYVVYEVRPSKTESWRKHLYRGETARVPKDFKEPIPMALLAEDIAEVHFEAWKGDDFSKDRWDSTNGETKDILPHLVRVQILSWEESAEDRQGRDIKPSVQYATVIYLPYAMDFNPLKQGSSSFSLFK